MTEEEFESIPSQGRTQFGLVMLVPGVTPNLSAIGEGDFENDNFSANGQVVRPKILASTATVRRAAEQIRALMGRNRVRAFPPAGPDPGESFFATVDRDSDGRLYVGLAAPGRTFRGP